jgi:two-component sensor histidine kinase
MHSYLGVPIEWGDGELFGTFCMLSCEANAFQDEYLELMRQFKDIIETDLRYMLIQAELEARLSAKDLELREIHHRLKNQLSILSSYISIQAQSYDDAEIRCLLKEVQHRVLAVSMIHDSLHKSSEDSQPTLCDYIPRLCDYILEDFVNGDIVAEYDIEELRLSSEAQINIALILSELITNSVKYAFPKGGEKRIFISARRCPDGRLFFAYRDSGIGLPESFELEQTETLGLLIIRALVEQMKGEMRAGNEGGAAFSFLVEA